MTDQKQQPVISVITAYYNVETYLEDCVRSVLEALSFIPHEFILVNDQSTDQSSVIGERLAEEHPTILHLQNTKASRGPAAARNLGISAAKGEYIAFVDADDLVQKSIFRHMLQSITFHKADVCICDASRLKGKSQTHCLLSTNAFLHCNENPTTLEKNPTLVYSAIGCDKLIRRDLLTGNQILFPEDILYEDVAFSFRVLSSAKAISLVRNVEYLWRIRGGSSQTVSTTQNRSDRRIFEDRIAICERILKAAGAICGPGTVSALEEKVLRFDFLPYMQTLHKRSKEEQKEIMSALAGFLERSIGSDTLQKIPVIDRELWSAIRKGDPERLTRLVFYKKENYKNVPLVEKNGQYFLSLNPALFENPEEPADHEFFFSVPKIYIRSVSVDDDRIRLFGWTFLHRFPIRDPEEQKNRFTLCNVVTGKETPLKAAFLPADEPTEKEGTVFNYDTYSETFYDYSGSGFSIELDPDGILKGCEEGDYLLLCNYEYPLCSGKRVIRGLSKEAKAALLSVTKQLHGKKLQFQFDGRKTIRIQISEAEEEPSVEPS